MRIGTIPPTHPHIHTHTCSSPDRGTVGGDREDVNEEVDEEGESEGERLGVVTVEERDFFFGRDGGGTVGAGLTGRGGAIVRSLLDERDDSAERDKESVDLSEERRAKSAEGEGEREGEGEERRLGE